jgi:hypothetical protein
MPRCRIKTKGRYNNLVALYKQVMTDKIRAGEYDSIKSDINNLYRLTLEKEIDLNYLSACKSAIKHIYLDSLRGKIETESITRISEILITLEEERVKPANDRIAQKINFREAAFAILKSAIERSEDYLKHNHLLCSKLNDILEQNFAPLVSKDTLETASGEGENRSPKLIEIYNSVQELLNKYSLAGQNVQNPENPHLETGALEIDENLNSQAVVDNSIITEKSNEAPEDVGFDMQDNQTQDSNNLPLLLGDFDAE